MAVIIITKKKEALTDFENKLWNFIVRFNGDQEAMPSLAHIAHKFKFTERTAHYWVEKLIKKNYIERVPRQQFRKYKIKN